MPAELADCVVCGLSRCVAEEHVGLSIIFVAGRVAVVVRHLGVLCVGKQVAVAAPKQTINGGHEISYRDKMVVTSPSLFVDD